MSEILSISTKESYKTTIFVPGDGYIYIKQYDQYGDHQTVMLSPYQANAFVELADKTKDQRSTDFCTLKEGE